MQDVNKVLAEEGEAAEQNKDAEVTPATKVSRPGRQRSTVFSVRLNDEEMAALQAEAEAQGVPASTLARAMIVRQLPAPERIVPHLPMPGKVHLSHLAVVQDLALSLEQAQVNLERVRRAFEQDVNART